MKPKINMRSRLCRPADALLPLAFIAAALMGREAMAFDLFCALMGVKIAALATSDGLRAAYARQPSMRYVQGSTLMALIAQGIGAAIALLLLGFFRPSAGALALAACGLLLNIEGVLYEYLYAVGDGGSAMMCRCITAVLTFAGLLLAVPAGRDAAFRNLAWPLLTSGLSALVGLAIGLALGGKLRPRMNAAILRVAPLSLLQTALWPVLAIFALAKLNAASWLPLFVGWAVCALARTPFRRSPMEARPLNWALLAVFSIGTIGILIAVFALKLPVNSLFPCLFGALALSAACSFALYGRLEYRRE